MNKLIFSKIFLRTGSTVCSLIFQTDFVTNLSLRKMEKFTDQTRSHNGEKKAQRKSCRYTSGHSA